MSLPKHWKKISSKTLFKCDEITVQEDTVELPNGKITTYVHTPSNQDSVIAIALRRNMILVQRELSYPTGEILWQLPGGSLLKGESPEKGAQRELAEESGYSASNTKMLGFYYAQNRKSNKKQYVVLCTDLFENKLAHDHDEFIESEFLPLKQIKYMIKNEEVKNINMLAALNVWLHHIDDSRES